MVVDVGKPPRRAPLDRLSPAVLSAYRGSRGSWIVLAPRPRVVRLCLCALGITPVWPDPGHRGMPVRRTRQVWRYDTGANGASPSAMFRPPCPPYARHRIECNHRHTFAARGLSQRCMSCLTRGRACAHLLPRRGERFRDAEVRDDRRARREGDMETQVLRLTGALALGMVGILAANPLKIDQPIAPLATSPPVIAEDVIDVLTVIHHGVVDHSQLGVNHGTDPSVKEFALMAVKDHREGLQSAYALATKLHVTPQLSEKAADLDKEFKKDIEDLKAKKDGRELDKEFMDEQIDLHQEAIGALKDLDEKTKDATLKGAITATLPKMEAHLDRAKQVRSKLSLSARCSKSSKRCESAIVRAGLRIGPPFSRERRPMGRRSYVEPRSLRLPR
jgi:putative membrane protein